MQILSHSYRHWLFVLLFAALLTLAGMSMFSRSVWANPSPDGLENDIYLPLIFRQPAAGTVPGL